MTTDFARTASIRVSPIQVPSMIETENKNLCLKFKSNEVNAISKFGKKNETLETLKTTEEVCLSCQIVRVGVIIGKERKWRKVGENERERIKL